MNTQIDRNTILSFNDVNGSYKIADTHMTTEEMVKSNNNFNLTTSCYYVHELSKVEQRAFVNQLIEDFKRNNNIT
jgi:hypothetical protein